VTKAFWKSCLSILAITQFVSGAHVAESRAATEGKLTPACKAAKRYMEIIEARDLAGIRDLFAENAEYTGPDGTTVNELDKIVASYERGLKNSNTASWHFRIANLLPFEKNGCLLEFATSFDQPNQFVLSAVDHIEVNAQGKVTKFLPYIASSNLKRIAAHVQNKAESAAAKP
jgi:hypothetical protein